MKFIPLQIQVSCLSADRAWLLSFGLNETDGMSLRLTRASASDRTCDKTVVAEIADPRQVCAIVDRIADVSMNEETLARELFDLLLTLASDSPGADCSRYLVHRLAEWIAQNRLSRLGRGHAA
jgi:hypothetical protein